MSRLWLAGFMAVSALGAADPVNVWLPIEPGNTWVYEKEFLDGRMDHPRVQKWMTEETIVSVSGDVAIKRVRVIGEAAVRETTETKWLIRNNCVYPDADGSRPPEYCFPMTVGAEWGRMTNTSPAEEYVWRVDWVNGDPYGVEGGKTFHFSAHIASGTRNDRWFAEGLGLVQEIEEHHGTYEELRARLVQATIGGQVRKFDLRPARTSPRFEADCEAVGWRKFVQRDGGHFPSEISCKEYVKKQALKGR